MNAFHNLTTKQQKIEATVKQGVKQKVMCVLCCLLLSRVTEVMAFVANGSVLRDHSE